MLTFPSSPVQEAPRCVSCLCLTRGIMGVEVQSIQEPGFLWWRNVAVCCCVLPASWKHISGLSSARSLLDQSSFLRLSVSTFPRSIAQTHTQKEQEKNKVGLTFPQCTISLNGAAFVSVTSVRYKLNAEQIDVSAVSISVTLQQRFSLVFGMGLLPIYKVWAGMTCQDGAKGTVFLQVRLMKSKRHFPWPPSDDLFIFLQV